MQLHGLCFAHEACAMAIPKAPMSQRSATARLGQPAPDSSAALEGLGRGWLILRNCRLGCARGRSLPSALIHPAKGVVLLDILPSESPGAVEAFRARLAAARFQAIFPGHLPVAHLRLGPHQLHELRGRLESAFAGQPPLSLPGGDAWVAAVTRALTTEPAVPRLRSRRIRRHSRRRSSALWRLAGAAVLAGAMLAAVYAATGIPQPHAPSAEARSAENPPAADIALTPAAQNAAAPPMPPPPAMAAAPDPAPAPAAPEPAALSPPPPPPAPVPEKPEITAPAAPNPLPPDRPAKPRAARAGLAAAGGQAPVPVPRPAPAARHPTREFPQPEKEDPSAKAFSPDPAALHPVPEPVRLPPIAERALPPTAGPAAAQPLPEPPLQRCHRIVYLVGQGVLLPDEELQFFQRACIRH